MRVRALALGAGACRYAWQSEPPCVQLNVPLNTEATHCVPGGPGIVTAHENSPKRRKIRPSPRVLGVAALLQGHSSIPRVEASVVRGLCTHASTAQLRMYIALRLIRMRAITGKEAPGPALPVSLASGVAHQSSAVMSGFLAPPAPVGVAPDASAGRRSLPPSCSAASAPFGFSSSTPQ